MLNILLVLKYTNFIFGNEKLRFYICKCFLEYMSSAINRLQFIVVRIISVVAQIRLIMKQSPVANCTASRCFVQGSLGSNPGVSSRFLHHFSQNKAFT